MPTKSVPDGYHTVTPYIVANGAARLMEFLAQAFDATEMDRHTTPDGNIMHAEMKIGDAIIMLGDGGEQYPPLPSSNYLYVPDIDATYKKAIEAGAESLSEPKDQFYGDRTANIKDPTGNYWFLATHVEDVSREELERRAAEFANQ